MEYRVVELQFGEETILSNKFDFGCTAIVQDKHTAFKTSNQLRDNTGAFMIDFVESVLFRMLDGKILDFSIVKTLDPVVIHLLFRKFNEWYEQDMKYLTELLNHAKNNGMYTGKTDEKKEESDDNSLFYLIYSMFKHHNVAPRETKSWAFEDVAEIVYFNERDAFKEKTKDMKMGGTKQ